VIGGAVCALASLTIWGHVPEVPLLS
jgi:hypothetical protein